jgi:hypothetical protein
MFFAKNRWKQQPHLTGQHLLVFDGHNEVAEETLEKKEQFFVR